MIQKNPSPLDHFLQRAEAMLDKVEHLLPALPAEPDWKAHAFRWRRVSGRGHLVPVLHPHRIRLDNLQGIEAQMQRLEQNTRQFVERRGANNALLTGAHGTGKSSLIKALLVKYVARGLRLIEVDKDELVDLPDIVDLIAPRPERFIIFCDDLSFEAGDPGYKAMKSVLDGSIAGMPDNLLVYATSNRRHLMPEYMNENLEARHMEDGEVHPGEAIGEKVSLSERFGLWLSFYPFDQDHYLEICAHWLTEFGLNRRQIESARIEALQWALLRGSRSGRVAAQFARDYAGRHSGKSGR